MPLKLRLLFGLLSLGAVGAVIYARTISKSDASAPAPVAISPGDICCGPDPVSALPSVNYTKPAEPAKSPN